MTSLRRRMTGDMQVRNPGGKIPYLLGMKDNQVRNLSSGNFLPFEKAIGRYEAKPFSECLSV